MTWRRERLPTPVFWPGEFHGLCSPRGRREWDTTERLSLHSTSPLWQGSSGPPSIDFPFSSEGPLTALFLWKFLIIIQIATTQSTFLDPPRRLYLDSSLLKVLLPPLPLDWVRIIQALFCLIVWFLSSCWILHLVVLFSWYLVSWHCWAFSSTPLWLPHSALYFSPLNIFLRWFPHFSWSLASQSQISISCSDLSPECQRPLLLLSVGQWFRDLLTSIYVTYLALPTPTQRLYPLSVLFHGNTWLSSSCLDWKFKLFLTLFYNQVLLISIPNDFLVLYASPSVYFLFLSLLPPFLSRTSATASNSFLWVVISSTPIHSSKIRKYHIF